MNREELLWKYIDGICTDEESQQVKQLLAEDMEFSKELELLQSVHSIAQNEMVIPAPKGFTQRVVAQFNKKFSILPFLSNGTNSRTILYWALGICGAAILAYYFNDISTAANLQDQVPQTPNFVDTITSSKVFWVLGVVGFLLGLDRFLHYRFIREETKGFA